MDIKHALSLNPLQPAYAPPRPHARRDRAARSASSRFAGGLREIGHDGAGFAFDNEGPRHKVWLEPFRLADAARHLRRVSRPSSPTAAIAGPSSGCRTAGRRCSARAGRRRSTGAREDDGWRVFTLPAGAPLDARRAGLPRQLSTRPTPSRAGPASGLPTEAEWEVAAAAPAPARRQSRWIAGIYHPRAGPAAAGARADDRRRLGMDAEPLCRLSAASAPPPARSANTTASSWSNQMVLRGGAAVTPAGHVRTTYRNFFPPARALGVQRHPAGGGCYERRAGRLPPSTISRRARRASATPCSPGWARRQKSIPCRFLYDARGSALFEAICELPEYYPTRTETRDPRGARRRDRGADRARTPARSSSAAAPAARSASLLRRVRSAGRLCRRSTSRASSCAVAAEAWPRDFPTLASRRGLRRLHAAVRPADRCPDRADDALGFFPGSTIGNFSREDGDRASCAAGRARARTRRRACWSASTCRRTRRCCDAAYNDAQGVTAAFNLNLLARVNRELDADFDLDRFAHDAFYNETAGRIEIYIRSLADQIVTVAGRASASPRASASILNVRWPRAGPRSSVGRADRRPP